MTRKLVTKKELKSIYGVPYSFAHIARLEAAGQFPRRMRLGACRVAWLAEEVQDWDRGARCSTQHGISFLKGGAPVSKPGLSILLGSRLINV